MSTQLSLTAAVLGTLALGASALSSLAEAQEGPAASVAQRDVELRKALELAAIRMAEVRAEAAPRPVSELNWSAALESAAEADAAVESSWLASIPTIQIDGRTLWIVEGDVRLDLAGLSDYVVRRELMREAFEAHESQRRLGVGHAAPRSLRSTGQHELLGEALPGTERVMRWSPGKTLTYRVIEGTFPDEATYQRTVDLFTKATEDWESICGVTFEHVMAKDSVESLGHEGCVFSVRYTSNTGSSGGLIASAFFPWDPAARRNVLVTPLLFSSGYDPRGVLRHECGHILGFRHEHIRDGSPPDCPDEDQANTVPLTTLDPLSVMHYFCGGRGSKTLEFTAEDRAGAVVLYGRPHSEFHFLD